jgi:Methyl-accepting chemotaxis protein
MFFDEKTKNKNKKDFNPETIAQEYIKGTVEQLKADSSAILGEIDKARFNFRFEEDKYNEIFSEAIESLNQVLASLTKRITWDGNIHNAIPAPIIITDTSLDIKSTNKAAQKLAGLTVDEIFNKKCSCIGADICGTEDCCVLKLQKGITQSECRIGDKYFSIDTSYLEGPNGERTGYIRVLQDITPLRRNMLFADEEINRLGTNLRLLSEGNLALHLDVAQGDEYTQETRQRHLQLNNSLKEAIESIVFYIEQTKSVLSGMSHGNFTGTIETEFCGDFAVLKEAINTIAASLNQVLLEIDASAEQVTIGSKQLSEGGQVLANGASQQASAIEELNATVEKIAVQTSQNAVQASEASELSMRTKEQALKCDTEMMTLVTSMEAINESSSQISSIVKDIQGIAATTNILSLNAAVEAARAGVHGKGFAVVAEEVRNLAGRSGESARKTEELLESSVKQIEKATNMVNNTAKSLQKIVADAEQIFQSINQIAGACNQQASAIEQVNTGIKDVSEVVQRNAATVQQSAASAEELYSQAEILKSLVGRFDLKRLQ